MTDWFRSWHGAPTDPKWILIARKASTLPGVASAIAWALFDHASQARPRGSITGFDMEFYAAFSGFDEIVVSGCISAMAEKGMIIEGSLANWNKRQPEREDGSAERAKAWRERNRTQPNAPETPQTASKRNRPTDTEQNRTDIPPPAGAEAPLAADPDADLFRRGKQVLGKQAGGLIAKLKAHFGGEIAKARAAVEIASTKGSGAADYIGRILAPPGTGPPNGRQPTRIDTLAEIQRNSHQAMIDERAFDANPTLDLSVTADPRGR